MAYTSFPRGSEWYRWDLHIHTPKSIIQHLGGDTKPAWDAFIQKIATLPADLKAIAVTDYLFCDGYEHLLTRKEEMPNIELIIPNIEFRLSTFSGTANNSKRHNFHVLFDPAVSVQDIREQLLNCLSTGYKIQDGTQWQQTPTVRSLAELGRQIKAAAPANNSLQNKPDLEVGFDNITYKREDIEKLLEKNCFKGRFVTAMGYSEWDQSRWDQSAAEKRTLINTAHFCLTSLDDPAKIEENRRDLKTNKLNSLVLHSSDAHAIDRVGKTMLWIKAEPTFSGLRQILCEPESRVSIGSTSPDEKDSAKVIKSLTISGADTWIADQRIEFNRDMVAIIGGKGSGKTALADFLGYAGGDFDADNENTFLTKAREQITGVKLQLEWERGGTEPEWRIHETVPSEKKVRYLSQSFVESLCSHDQHGKLIEQIEAILYQYVPKTAKLGAPDFSGLKDLKTRPMQLEVAKISANIRSLNAEVAALETEIAKKPALQRDLEKQRKEKAQLEAQKPVPPNAVEQQVQDELQRLRGQKANLEKTVESLRVTINELAELRTRARLLKTDIDKFNVYVTGKVASWGLSDKTESLKASIASDFDLIVGARADALEKEVQKIEGRADDPDATTETIANAEKHITAIESKSQLEAQQKAKVAEFGRRIAELNTNIERLEKAISELETAKPGELSDRKLKRALEYKQFFVKLDEKKKALEELYKPLNESTASGAERGKVEFYARFKFDARRFVTEGMNLFDGRKMVVRGDQKMIELAEAAWKTLQGEMPSVSTKALDDLVAQLSTTEKPISSQLTGEFGMTEFYNWIFDVACFDVEYGLKYEKVDIAKLSPGRKGVVLLMIYLEVDKDYRPLIIDQPEENLDNRSVYATLVEYFRRAKKKRQIFLVTHNANLVVNADAEQVIVANFDLDRERQPKVLEYISGSLEFSRKPDAAQQSVLDRQGIREHVCEILEGGDEAFQKREGKYRLQER